MTKRTPAGCAGVLYLSGTSRFPEPREEEDYRQQADGREGFCPPGDVANLLGDFRFPYDGDGVRADCADSVAEQPVAVLHYPVLNQHGVARAVDQAVVADDDAVVAKAVHIRCVVTGACVCLGVLCRTASRNEGE